MKFELRKCESSRMWDDFVEKSPQQNVFSTSAFMDAHGASYHRWLVTDAGEPAVAVLVIEPSQAGFIAPSPYTQYQGICFSASKRSSHSTVTHQLRVLDFLLAELSRIYQSLSFCLHPTIVDLRAIQWFHYHSPEMGIFDIDLQYTGLIFLHDVAEFGDYLASIRKVRLQEYKKAFGEGFKTECSADLAAFTSLYVKTFERQGILLQHSDLDRVVSIARAALREGFGHLFLCRSPSGAPASAALFLFDHRSAYYLFGASDPEYRKTGASSYLLLEGIKYFYDRGFRDIDMVGVNSPNRGDFKTSLNALPTPYFNVTWRRPCQQLNSAEV
jgi:hypothetical protein